MDSISSSQCKNSDSSPNSFSIRTVNQWTVPFPEAINQPSVMTFQNALHLPKILDHSCHNLEIKLPSWSILEDYIRDYILPSSNKFTSMQISLLAEHVQGMGEVETRAQIPFSSQVNKQPHHARMNTQVVHNGFITLRKGLIYVFQIMFCNNVLITLIHFNPHV